MCQLTVTAELERLKWATTALSRCGASPGSFEDENAHNAAEGIRARLQWCIDCINKDEHVGRKSP